MAKAQFKLMDFKGQVLGSTGLARSNRFEVLIPSPPGLGSNSGASNLVSLYVEQASMPLLNIFAKSQKIFGPSYQRPITSEYGGEGLPMTFHVDRDMQVRRFFEDWMHLIVDPNTFTVGYQSDYISDILIRQIDEQDNITHEIKLLEAFPRNMNIMDMNNMASNQTHRLNILFAYRYWVNTARAQTQATDIPRSFVNPQVPVIDNSYTGALVIPQNTTKDNVDQGNPEE